MTEKDMSEKRSVYESEMLDQIRQSAEFVEVPESLSPENILEKCRNLPQEKQESEKPDKGAGGRKKFRIRNPRIAFGLSAAAVFIICCISLRGMEISKFAANSSSGQYESAAADMAVMEEGAEVTEECAPEAAPAGGGEQEEEQEIERKDAGEFYTLAGSYDAVYERLEEVRAEREEAVITGGGIVDLERKMDMLAEAEATNDMADTGSSMNARKEAMSVPAEEAERYSETNVQTYGIDESDIVKTDGEYIYLLRGSSVSIIAAGEEMKQVGELKPDTADDSASACAMYVDGNKLILMMQEYTTALEEKETEDMAYRDMLYIDTNRSVSVLTYDISNKKKPVLRGKVTQDGTYMTSRKDGNIVYLFTEQYLAQEYEENFADAIPEVNARKIAADCIYMGGRGGRALIISSVSLYHPETVRDTVMLLDDGAEVYMGEDSLYLYRTNYREARVTTEIAKFSLTGGFLNGEAAASVRGNIRDTFAINEKDNKLRVLTTDTSGADWENRLVLLDENLKVTGTLEHIAVGESIYAARYLGDMAYFITYRNTDPLFAADLSDEKNPKLLGELEITGFSEYLHFWGEDKLLGLGYEADPKTGERKGMKLVMFDMSDPANLKTLGSKVLEKTSYSPALYDYKTILVSPQENLIGFITEYYQKGVVRKYELYRWNGDKFEEILSEDVTADRYDNANYRGLYIGEKFYIAHPEVVRYYDRADYKLRQKLEMK